MACAHYSKGVPQTGACRLPATIRKSHALAMFVISEAEAAAIRATYKQRGEFSAAIELRQLFPGIADNAQARECVRTIVSWRPLPKRLCPMKTATQ
jgi:hypothetical protein